MEEKIGSFTFLITHGGYISAEKLFLIADISALQDAQNPQFHIFSKDLALPVSRFAFI